MVHAVLLLAITATQNDRHFDQMNHLQRFAHVTANPDTMVPAGSILAQAARGRVTVQTGAGMRVRFGSYFRASRFLEWEDVRPPFVRFSGDSTMAFRIVEKRVRLLVDGRHEAVRYVWTESWVREVGRWELRFVTSTDHPEPADSIPLAAREEAWRILDALRRAAGGATAVAGVPGISYRADVVGPRSTFTTSVAAARDGRAVMRQDFPGRAPVTVRLRAREPADPDSISTIERSILEGHDVMFLAIAPESRLANPRARSDESFDGGAHTVIRFTDILGGEVDALYDRRTGLPTAMRMINHTGQGARDVLLRFSDWRSVDGIRLPFAVTFEHGGDVYRYAIREARVGWP